VPDLASAKLKKLTPTPPSRGVFPSSGELAPPRPSADTQHPVRVAVVGCGYWGPNLIRNFEELVGSDVRIVCDRDAERLASIERRFPSIVTLTDFNELLADPQIDAIAICTPIHTHFGLARQALEAGKHVLVEKPLTDSVETSQKLVELARANHLTLMVDHTFVYSGAVRKIKSMIESEDIGDILYFDSVRINLGLFQHDSNVLWDLAPHDVSIMSFLIERDPQWVSAIGSAHFGDLENMAYVTVQFDGPLIAHFHVNWLAPVKIRSTVIGGSKRMIVYDDLAPSEKVRVYDKGVSINGDPDDRRQAMVDYRSGDMFAPQIDNTEPLRNVCHGFVQAINTGRHPLADGDAGLRTVRIIEAAQTSMSRSGQRIRV